MVLKTRNDANNRNQLGTHFSVQLPTGIVLPVTLQQFEPLRSVYSSVASAAQVALERVRVKYTGKVLSESSTVNSLGIMDEMVLKAEIITVKEISLNIDFDGSIVHVEGLKNTDKTSKIWDKLKQSGHSANLMLKVNGNELSQNTTLFDAKINSLSKIVATEVVLLVHTSNDVIKSTSQSHEPLPGFDAGGKRVEVVFSFDTTGSMANILNKVRVKLAELMERLLHDVPDIRIGMIAHGDYGDDHLYYVIRSHDLGVDTSSLKNFAMNCGGSGGGGNGGEAYELVLQHAQHMDWSEDSAKALVVIGDELPHVPSFTKQNIYWHTELDILQGMGIKIYGVRAESGCRQPSIPFYKELAERTGGTYVDFTNFDLVGEMFLAVCYKESGDQQLEDYMADLEETGHLDEQKEQMLEQLKTKIPAVEESQAIGSDSVAFDPKQSRNYVAEPWFDRRLDKGTPQYTFTEKTGKWDIYRSPGTDVEIDQYIQSRQTLRKNGRFRRSGLLACFGR